MRQKRKKRVWFGTFAVVIGFVSVAVASVAALSWAGWIQWTGEAALSDLAFWRPKLNGSVGNVPQKEPNAKAEAPNAGSGPKEGTAASPQPSGGSKTGSAQLLAQAQSIVAVSANERAWLERLGSVKLEPDKLFSFNAWVKEGLSQKLEAKEQEISHIASLVYESALRTGLVIGERHIHPDLPDYAASGFDVAYSPDKKDLTFYNPFDFTVQLGVSYTGDYPIVYFTGTPTDKWKAPKLTVQKETFAPDKIVLSDFSLVSGEVKRDNGKDGLLVKVFCECKQDGRPELLTKDFYAPHPQVIARAPSPEEKK